MSVPGGASPSGNPWGIPVECEQPPVYPACLSAPRGLSVRIPWRQTVWQPWGIPAECEQPPVYPACLSAPHGVWTALAVYWYV